MTPSEILTQARSQFDDPSSTFIGDDEGYNYIWQGVYELCAKSDIKQVTDTSITTVSGTADYTMPVDGSSLAVFLKVQQITWDDQIIFRRDLAKYQQITGDSPSSGNPQWYRIFGETLSLTPTPTSAATVKIWGFAPPTKYTSANANVDIFVTDGIPESYQQDVIDYVLMRMYLKDDDRKAIEHQRIWEQSIQRIQLEQKQKDNGDDYATVMVVDDVPLPWSSY